MKKIAAFMLAVLMLTALFAGCNGDEASNPSNTAAPTAAPGSNPSSAVTGEAGGLPLAETPVTISAWWPAAFGLTVISKMEENHVFIEMAKRTNVSVTFTTPAGGSVNEAFNLMIASQDYPDMIQGFPQYYTKGLDFAIEDTVIQPLEDYLDIMPNIKALRDGNNEIRKQTTTDNGHFAGIPAVKVDEQGNGQGAWLGGVIRQDWLDKLNMEVPTTYDELETVLTAMKDNGLAENPLWVKSDCFSFANSLYAGFNTTGGLLGVFYQVDGVAKYAPFEPGYREYLEKLNDWYKKGLFASDFYTMNDFYPPVDKVANSAYGVFDSIYTWGSTYKLAAADADFKLTAMRALVKNKGDAIHLRMQTDAASTSLCVGYGSENTELVCRFWDYLFSDEGILLSNYGMEGETFEYDGNNEPKWIGPLVSTEAGFNLSDTQGAYFLYNSAGYVRFDREYSVVDPEAVAYCTLWNLDGADYNYPSAATMTSDENTNYANVMGDVNTLISETVVKFVTGEKSFDEYDAFVEQLKAMGVDTAIAAKQAALDRYNAR